MAPNETIDQLVLQLVRTAAALRREADFVSGSADVPTESELLGGILAQYFEGSPRRLGEAVYAALERADLNAEALGFNGIWRTANPQQRDLWIPEEDEDGGNRN